MTKKKTDKVCFLIDVKMSQDRTVLQNEAEKKFKHKIVSMKIQGIVIIGTTYTVTKGLKKYLVTTTGRHSPDCVQEKQLY
jgi:hypothetical protein